MTLGVVEAVADREAVGDLEADVAGGSTSVRRRSGLVSRAQTSSEAGSRASRLRSRYWRVRPESTMSSTISTWRPWIGASRSFMIRTTPEESVCDP